MFLNWVDRREHRALQARVRRLETLVQELYRRAELDPDATFAESSGVSPRVHELLAAGQKIQAIKVVREETGLGLAEAKALVDRL